MTDRETLDLYEATGALLRGHFRLTSGLHSDIYLQSALVLQYPAHAAALGAALATSFRDDGIQTVLAPAIGGILVAHEVARALGVRGLFTEREDGVMRLRREFTVARGERCLVVEDVMTTGGSIREVVTCVEALGGVVVGVGLADRPERRRSEFSGQARDPGDGEGDHLEAGRVSALPCGRPGDQARQPRLKRPPR